MSGKGRPVTGGDPEGRERADAWRSTASVPDDRYARAAARLLSRHAAKVASIEIERVEGAVADFQAIARTLRRRSRRRLLLRLITAVAVLIAFAALTLQIFFRLPLRIGRTSASHTWSCPQGDPQWAPPSVEAPLSMNMTSLEKSESLPASLPIAIT